MKLALYANLAREKIAKFFHMMFALFKVTPLTFLLKLKTLDEINDSKKKEIPFLIATLFGFIPHIYLNY